jgi:hypothetical protein
MQPWYTDQRMLAAGNARRQPGGDPLLSDRRLPAPDSPPTPSAPRESPPVPLVRRALGPAMPDLGWVRPGAECVEYREHVYAEPSLGAFTTIAEVQPAANYVRTADGVVYNYPEMYRAVAGRHGGRTLVPVDDLRVLTVRAHVRLANVARLAARLAELPARSAKESVERLVVIFDAAHQAWIEVDAAHQAWIDVQEMKAPPAAPVVDSRQLVLDADEARRKQRSAPSDQFDQ